SWCASRRIAAIAASAAASTIGAMAAAPARPAISAPGAGGTIARRYADELRGEGDLLHTAGRRGQCGTTGRVLPLRRLQSLERTRGRSRERAMPLLRH